MPKTLTDHAEILNTAGKRHLFPVRDPATRAIGFAESGQLEGRKPIGWNEFFPELRRAHTVVIYDEEAGSLTVGAPPPATSPQPVAKPD